MAAIILRSPQVRRRLGDAARSTIYGWIKDGLLVKPVKIGPRASGWPENEVDAIAEARIAGKSEDEIRLLVIKLEASRGKG